MNNIFDSIPDNLSAEAVQTLVESDKTRIVRIISRGHKSPVTGWYDQDSNEWIIVLKGEAILSFVDKSTVNLKAGDYVNIPAHKKHKVAWTAPDLETVWLAVHY